MFLLQGLYYCVFFVCYLSRLLFLKVNRRFNFFSCFLIFVIIRKVSFKLNIDRKGRDCGYMQCAGSVTPCTYLPEVIARGGRTMFVTSSTRLPACGSCSHPTPSCLFACLWAIITCLLCNCDRHTCLRVSVNLFLNLLFALFAREQARKAQLQSDFEVINFVVGKQVDNTIAIWVTRIYSLYGKSGFDFYLDHLSLQQWVPNFIAVRTTASCSSASHSGNFGFESWLEERLFRLVSSVVLRLRNIKVEFYFVFCMSSRKIWREDVDVDERINGGGPLETE
jgi:hypothetical protein